MGTEDMASIIRGICIRTNNGCQCPSAVHGEEQPAVKLSAIPFHRPVFQLSVLLETRELILILSPSILPVLTVHRSFLLLQVMPKTEFPSYSNYGPTSVDVAAPGDWILSTYPTALGYDYIKMKGTSMATPQVSGLAALLLSVNPSLSVRSDKTINPE